MLFLTEKSNLWLLSYKGMFLKFSTSSQDGNSLECFSKIFFEAKTHSLLRF